LATDREIVSGPFPYREPERNGRADGNGPANAQTFDEVREGGRTLGQEGFCDRAGRSRAGGRRKTSWSRPTATTREELTFEEAQRRHIEAALERTGWRVRGEGGAAEALALKPTTLETKIRKLGIRRSE